MTDWTPKPGEWVECIKDNWIVDGPEAIRETVLRHAPKVGDRYRVVTIVTMSSGHKGLVLDGLKFPCVAEYFRHIPEMNADLAMLRTMLITGPELVEELRKLDGEG